MAIHMIDRTLSFNSNHSDRVGAPKGIVMHHAAGDGSVEHIHQIHKSIGYAGIGYHIYVRKDGRVYRGRPEAWVGAHAQGFNDRIGVCAEGNFETETMSAVQREALTEVLRYLFGKYGKLSVVGHRELNATACPGKNYPLAAIVKAASGATASSTSSAGVRDAVRAFQKACLADGVSVGASGADGIWGKDTESAANNILVRGSRGARVRVLQTRLKELGYDLGTSGDRGIDGDYGAKTEAAVNAFKVKRRMLKNGRVGIKVWKALLGV